MKQIFKFVSLFLFLFTCSSITHSNPGPGPGPGPIYIKFRLRNSIEPQICSLSYKMSGLTFFVRTSDKAGFPS